MNASIASIGGAREIRCTADTCMDLVTELMRYRASIGDGLNEVELTEFLKFRLPAPDENGFCFLCCSNGNVTFSVPPQDPAAWYGEHCTISAGKEKLAKEIAEKHQLTLCEPPDKLQYGSPGPGDHRHLEFANRWRSVAVAHPHYVKLRVSGGGEHEDVVPGSEAAIAQCARLLRDLAPLYR
ncbi:MAG: hypothetical protein ACXW3Z_15320 [Limisphaerales bacterium]